jgi:hypothetical protein
MPQPLNISGAISRSAAARALSSSTIPLARQSSAFDAIVLTWFLLGSSASA